MPSSSRYSEHYTALGQMLVAFQSLEATLKDGLVLLLNQELGTPSGNLAFGTIAELSFSVTIRIAAAVPSAYSVERIEAIGPGAVTRLKAALQAATTQLNSGLIMAQDVEERRNQLIHSRWLVSDAIVPSPGAMFRMKTSTRKGVVSSKMVAEFIADILACANLAKDAQALVGGALQDFKLIAGHKWR